MVIDHGSDRPDTDSNSLMSLLATDGYWPAQAARSVAEGKLSVAVQICRENLSTVASPISGRLLYGTALFFSEQREAATEQFYQVLAADPNNLVALKYLGDIMTMDGDHVGAAANYRRILEIDPYCQGLASPLRKQPTTTTRTVTIKRPAENQASLAPLQKVPFFTETIGDLYLEQGHPRLASIVFRHLVEENSNPRLVEKLAAAEAKVHDKEG